MLARKTCKYYTRSKRVGGKKVVREYVGSGLVGEMAAESDRLAREKRKRAREHLKAVHAAERTQEAALIDYYNAVSAVLTEVLEASGYHNHKGQWRLKRGTKESRCS
jgi:hypothetical protein